MKKDSDLNVLIAVFIVAVVFINLSAFMFAAINDESKSLQDAKRWGGQYLKQNNINNADVVQITANRVSKKKSKTSGVLYFVFTAKTNSESQEKYQVTDIKYKQKGKTKSLDLEEHDSSYLEVKNKATMTKVSGDEKPKVTVESHQDKEESKDEKKVVIYRNIHLTVPENYQFTENVDLGGEDNE